VLKVENNLVVYNQGEKDEYLQTEWIDTEEERVEPAVRQESIEKRRRKGEKYEFKRSYVKKDEIHE
jgi:hypothetical protein